MGSIPAGKLSAWFDAYSGVLVLYARQWLAIELAEDTVQEVFLRLMSQSAAPRNVKGWLFRAVRNAAINRLRSLKRRKKHEQIRATNQAQWFENSPEARIDAAAAQETLASLPLHQREIVVLRIWGDMRLQQVSDIVGLPVSTVFDKYRLAIHTIRKMMGLSCEKAKNSQGQTKG